MLSPLALLSVHPNAHHTLLVLAVHVLLPLVARVVKVDIPEKVSCCVHLVVARE